MNPLIETVNLSVQYDKVKALNNLNIQLPQNKKIAIIGPNGAGKSTFIKACLGLIPYDGQVSVLNQTIKQSRQQIAYVPQRSNVNWTFQQRSKMWSKWVSVAIALSFHQYPKKRKTKWNKR